MNGIKSCPVCGNEDFRIGFKSHAAGFYRPACGYYYVLCDQRLGGCGQSAIGEDGIDHAVSNWNNRKRMLPRNGYGIILFNLGAYYENFFDFFSDFFDSDPVYDSCKNATEFVFLAAPNKIELRDTARDVIEKWCERPIKVPRVDDASVDKMVNELQSLVDDWCKKQLVLCYSIVRHGEGLGRLIRVPWCEWFGVKERDS